MSKVTPYKKAVATTGSYRDRNGDEKKRYVNVGTLFKYEDGGLALKLDSIPVGEGWNGFISFFDIEDKREGQKQEATRDGGGKPQERFEIDDEIPF